MYTIIVLVTAALPAFAGTITVTIPFSGNPNVYSAINANGVFSVSSDMLDGQFLNGNAVGGSAYTTGTTIFAGGLNYAASGGGYSDAGLVFFFTGGLTLGDIQSVSVNSTGSPVRVNLWLDTGNNGTFFNFDSSGLYLGLNGDSYFGCGAPSITLASNCTFFGGVGSGIHTLADLQSGTIAGINGNTKTALWIGVTHPNGGSAQQADISSITVTTTEPVPEPASLMLLGTGLAGLGMRLKKRLSR